MVRIFRISSFSLLLTFFASNAFGTNPNQAGLFEGTAFNLTYHQAGTASLVISATDESTGAVDATFQASNGLLGEGRLHGTIRNSQLNLEGRLTALSYSFRMIIDGKFGSDGALQGEYRLEPLAGTPGGIQTGTIDLKPAGPSAAGPAARADARE